jgi:DNA-directed RNA polymerase sigma subunit (sigma70/sigma32)
VGKKLGVSRERIRQIEEKAIEKMKESASQVHGALACAGD